jgi:hypothetical protein
MINPHDNPVILLGDEGTLFDSHDFVTVVSSETGAILYDKNPYRSSISFTSRKDEPLIRQTETTTNKKSKCCKCLIF